MAFEFVCGAKAKVSTPPAQKTRVHYQLWRKFRYLLFEAPSSIHHGTLAWEHVGLAFAVRAMAGVVCTES